MRRLLYAAALPAAFRWNAPLKTFYRHLTERGKPHAVALVALRSRYASSHQY